MLPNEDMFNIWIANNITDDGEKERLQERVKECFSELRESGFYNTESSKTAEVSGETPNIKKGKKITPVLAPCIGRHKGLRENQNTVLEALK